MKRVKWELSIARHSGEIYVEDETDEEELNDLVREDAVENNIDWTWEVEDDAQS